MKNTIIICATVLIGLLLVLVFFKDKITTFLPFLILLACPLMHIFMMKGMHNHKDSEQKDGGDKNNKSCH